MSDLDQKKVKKLIHKLALKRNMLDEEYKKIVESPYEFMKEKMNDLNIRNETNPEVIRNMKTNFLFPRLMKLIVDPEKSAKRNKNRINRKNNGK